MLGKDGSFTGTFGVFRDITECIREEKKISAVLEEKEVLLKEIHNRVKNNLLHSYSISSNKINLKIDINKAYLNINQAIPMGLIHNELITDSLIYAFNSNIKGVIKIEVSIDKAEEVTFVY